MKYMDRYPLNKTLPGEIKVVLSDCCALDFDNSVAPFPFNSTIF